MKRRQIFILFVIAALCPVLYPVPFAFSQTDTADPDYSGPGDLHPDAPREVPPDDPLDVSTESHDSYDGPYGDSYDEETFEEPTSASSGNVIVEINSEMPEEVEEAGSDLISLDLKGIDIIEVFRILSLKTGKTVVASKGVSGRINLFLNNVTFEDVLEVILITQGLAIEEKGNILMVMRNVEYKRRYGKDYAEKREFRNLKLEYARPSSVFNVLSKLKSDIGKIIVDEGSGTIILIDIPEKIALMEKVTRDMDRPLETKIFNLNYAKTDAMRDHLSAIITDGPGRVVIDERTSKIIVSDLGEKMKHIMRMMDAFDEESQQVFIEAMILQITLKKEFQRGIDWQKVLSNPWPVWLKGLDTAGTFPATPSFSPSPTLTASNTTMTIGTVSSDHYTFTLKFLESFGDTKILSRPKIAVINNEEAKILVGAREAYVTQTLSQGESTTVTSESVDFIDVGVKLNVIPTIHRDGFITLRIKPEVSSVRETLATSLGSNIPIVETSEAETVVKVKSGTTIMIAGLMKEEQRDDVSGFPFFNKIPFLGTFFSGRGKLNKKTELIIFIRPHIMTGETALAGNEAETLIPHEIWPDEMKRNLVLEELEKIGSSSAGPRVLLEANKNPTQPSTAQSLRTPVEQKGENTGIQGKLKGLRDY